MKIVYFFPQLAKHAGTERILIDKMNYLAEHYGYEVYALTYEQGNFPLAYPLSDKVIHVDLCVPLWHVYKYNYVKRTFIYRGLKKKLFHRFDAFISDVRPDILIVTPYHEEILEMALNSPHRMVRLVESHLNKRFSVDKDPIIEKFSLHRIPAWTKMRRIEKYISRFDYMVVLNKGDADDWSKYIRTKVIYNMVHLNESEVSSLENKKVLFVGRYSKQKGIPDLFRVWELVYQRHPDWQLNLYGGMGEDYEYALAEADRLQTNIRVSTETADIFNEYRESSIFVLTSIYEPFGLVLPEAMSCGLPVVSFDCPYGPANIINDGIDGFLIKERDINAFADRVCNLIEDINLRQRMGRAAIISSKRFAADKIMPEWKILFDKLVNDCHTNSDYVL